MEESVVSLLTALAREAKALGCARMDWAVLDWNEKARAFYTHIGAHHSKGWDRGSSEISPVMFLCFLLQ